MEPRRTAVPGHRVGPYVVGELLDHGGMGEVYRGRDLRLNRDVALKRLSHALRNQPRARKRFLRETRMATRVVHPYVTTVFDVVEDGDELILVMEYVRGRRLDHVLQRHSEPERILQWAIEIAEALSAIHDTGLIHRDVKPSNVMITEAGHAKLMDFGIARLATPDSEITTLSASRADEATALTLPGAGIGTVRYMSPEQVRGEPLDRRSDLFSFGVVLYEALSGTHPFARPTPHLTAQAIVGEEPNRGTTPESLARSEAVHQVIRRLLRKDRRERHPGARDVLRDLRAAVAGQPVERDRTRRRASRTAGGVAISAGLALAVAIGVFAFQPPAPRADIGGGTTPPLALVLPFVGSAGDAEASGLRGQMLASLLRADLSQSSGLGVVGSVRTGELLAAMPRGTAAGDSLLSLAGANLLITGRFEQGDGETVAAVELFSPSAPDKTTAFRVRGRDSAELVDRISARVLEQWTPAASLKDDPPAAALASSSEPALLAAERGRLEEQRGDLTASRSGYSEAVERDPGYLDAHLGLARTRYLAGDVAAARTAIERAREVAARSPRPPTDAALAELAALRARIDEDREAEIRAYERLRRLRPTDPAAAEDLAIALLAAGRPEEALAVLQPALAARPADASLSLLQVRLLRESGRLDEAAEVLEQVAREVAARGLTADATAVMTERGQLATASGRYEEARGLYAEVATRYAAAGRPLHYAASRRREANSLLRQGHVAAAVEPLEQAARAAAGAGNRRFEGYCLDSLGAALFQLGRLERAEEVLRQALERIETTAGERVALGPMINLASLLNYTGRSEEGRRLARRAYDVASSAGEERQATKALLQLAVAEQNEARLRDAAASYEAVVERTGGTGGWAAWAWSGLAEVRTHLGDLPGALRAADAAVEAHDHSRARLNAAYARLARARILRLMGAGERFERALERIAAEADALGGAADLSARLALERGWWALEHERFDEARSLFLDAAGAEKSTDLTALAIAGDALALSRAGEAARAVARAEEARAAAGSEVERIATEVVLSRCLAAARRADEARATAVRVVDDADSRGLAWPLIDASVVLLGLPAGQRPVGRGEIERRGRTALVAMMERLPAEDRPSWERRPSVREALNMLQPRPSGSRSRNHGCP